LLIDPHAIPPHVRVQRSTACVTGCPNDGFGPWVWGLGGATQRPCSQATGCVRGGIHSRRERGGSRGCDPAPPCLDPRAILGTQPSRSGPPAAVGIPRWVCT